MLLSWPLRCAPMSSQPPTALSCSKLRRDGRALRMVIGATHLNAAGLVHGGALFTLASFAFFAAVNAAGRLAVGISMNLSCFKAVKGGTLVAEATELARSRRLANCEVRVTDAGGELVAHFQGTAYLKDAPFPPQGNGV